MLKLCQLIHWSSLASRVIRYNSERGPPKSIPAKFGPIWLSSFRRKNSNTFPIASYVKTMLADVEGLGWWASSLDSNLKGHLRTIPTKFGPNWPSSFKGEDFKTFFP